MTNPDRAQFQTTRWTQVLAARGESPDAQQALRDLFEAYHQPIEGFIHQYCDGREEARDLSQEFISKLLAGNPLGGVDRTRGKFRTYLLGAVKHFLANQRDRVAAAKRSAGEKLTSLHGPDGTAIEVVDPQGFPPDAFFDHAWAVAVVEQGVRQLQSEAEGHGEPARFAVMRNWLIASEDGGGMELAAQSLSMSANAFKVAVHRLRKRFRQIIKEKISATIEDPGELQEELSYLIAALTSQTAADSLP